MMCLGVGPNMSFCEYVDEQFGSTKGEAFLTN
jgi:hypothetical protein